METSINQQNKKYKPLGEKTLLLLILKRSKFLQIILLVSLGIFVLSKFIPSQYMDILANAFLLCLALFIITACITFWLGWLEYNHYGISIEEDSFRITRGLFNEEEIGVSYRFIQEVRIERGISDQAFGVSNIIVMVLGEAEGQPFSEVSKMVLPAIDKDIASEVRNSILSRSDSVKKSITS